MAAANAANAHAAAADTLDCPVVLHMDGVQLARRTDELEVVVNGSEREHKRSGHQDVEAEQASIERFGAWPCLRLCARVPVDGGRHMYIRNATRPLLLVVVLMPSCLWPAARDTGALQEWLRDCECG